MIGLSASAFNISRDLAGLAKEVHITTRADVTGIFGKHPDYDNLWVHPMVSFSSTRANNSTDMMNIVDTKYTLLKF